MEISHSRPGPPSTRVIELPPEERQRLEAIARSGKTEQRLGKRVRMVLSRADGKAVEQIARELSVDRKNVRRWCDRYMEVGLEGLFDRPRPGRPRALSLLSNASH